jgi:hypothetical protein
MTPNIPPTMMAMRARAQSKPHGDMEEAEFRARFTALLAQAPPHLVRESAFVVVPATLPPWFDTGIELTAGEHVTVFAVGRVWLARALDLRVQPDVQLWYRIGDAGEVFRGTRCSHSFIVGETGRLFLGNYFPGEWATRTGALAVPADAYSQMEGGLCAVVVRWAVPPLEGLQQLVTLGDVASLLSSEIDRLVHPVTPPDGWEYLWFLGPAEIYTAGPPAPQRPSIQCYTHRDVGILHYDVSMPLTPDTRVRWAWKVDSLPAQEREDQFHTHDYLSIAVEFDNGQDLTYFWSATLPPETGFRCPIPTWQARETHVVVRSGLDGLGRWWLEERPLYTDYQRWVGPPPTRIVRVWLIANSLFGRREGQCEYGAIELQAGETIVTVN